MSITWSLNNTDGVNKDLLKFTLAECLNIEYQRNFTSVATRPSMYSLVDMVKNNNLYDQHDHMLTEIAVLNNYSAQSLNGHFILL